LTAELQSIDDQVAAWVGQAFDAYADRCETTLVKVFNRSGSDAVDLRAWLYEASPWGDPVGRADTMHDEPLYTVGMYLGLNRTHSIRLRYCRHMRPWKLRRDGVQSLADPR
jgi:hypothetical protein